VRGARAASGELGHPSRLIASRVTDNRGPVLMSSKNRACKSSAWPLSNPNCARECTAKRLGSEEYPTVVGLGRSLRVHVARVGVVTSASANELVETKHVAQSRDSRLAIFEGYDEKLQP